MYNFLFLNVRNFGFLSLCGDITWFSIISFCSIILKIQRFIADQVFIIWVKYWQVVIQTILLWWFKPSNDICKNTSKWSFNQAWNYLVSNILGWSSEHFFKLSCTQSLDDHSFLLFFPLIFSFKHISTINSYYFLVVFSVHRLQKSFSSFLHFNQSTFKSLPKLIILFSPCVRSMPNIVSDEFFNLSLPALPQKVLFNWLYSYH